MNNKGEMKFSVKRYALYKGQRSMRSTRIIEEIKAMTDKAKKTSSFHGTQLHMDLH